MSEIPKLTALQEHYLKLMLDQGTLNPTGNRGKAMVLRGLERKGLCRISLGYPYGFSITDAGRSVAAALTKEQP